MINPECSRVVHPCYLISRCPFSRFQSPRHIFCSTFRYSGNKCRPGTRTTLNDTVKLADPETPPWYKNLGFVSYKNQSYSQYGGQGASTCFGSKRLSLIVGPAIISDLRYIFVLVEIPSRHGIHTYILFSNIAKKHRHYAGRTARLNSTYNRPQQEGT